MESSVRCIGCSACVDVCPASAVSGEYRIDRNLCTHCFKCTDICYAESKRVAGRGYTVEDLYKEIEKDRPFYSLYGGGVTFSGGEPLTHGPYLKEIAKKCRANGINVMVESCGCCAYEKYEEALPYIDAMFLDIKHIDPETHKTLTGADNALILDNAKRLSDFGLPITVRTPVIPGYTDAEENIKGIADFVAALPAAREYELLAYHSFGESKYAALGRPYELQNVSPPSDEDMKRLVRLANRILQPHGKQCFYVKDNRKETIQ
jgi:pyruvate formate lyase activating enzyme